jgi:ElaB/YqjD/DUF883 family membrane-anchored ribosome-binding protein
MAPSRGALAVVEGLNQRLQQGWWDQFRAGAADVAGRAWSQVRAVAGGLTQVVAHRAGEGVAALAGRITVRPLSSVAVAFLLGLAVGALLRRRRLLAKRTSR